eukprot:CAMPEP_0184866054 /NCGR_PEP_ID=MMETSP0580-20130426/20560_1 /TAXON_ID=1118495 /ORGANISM="Dactyliosolen fragilissimus" /LENGTH=227 /DNA_ID=CAMNT_0027365515 /DNA_START=73 /DNA_END=759 /DNA_ORIENTATION=+
MEQNKSIFVTVGTTLFDPLIHTIFDRRFLNLACKLGYRHLNIQFGKGSVAVFDADSSTSQKEKYESDDALKSETLNGVYHHPSKTSSILWQAYRFKPSLLEDMKEADLIISHAGAGSIMEGLNLCREANNATEMKKVDRLGTQSKRQDFSSAMKKLVVIINDKLMHNHQTELAEALEKRGHLYVLSRPDELCEKEVWSAIEKFVPEDFQDGDHFLFGKLIDKEMGFL